MDGASTLEPLTFADVRQYFLYNNPDVNVDVNVDDDVDDDVLNCYDDWQAMFDDAGAGEDDMPQQQLLQSNNVESGAPMALNLVPRESHSGILCIPIPASIIDKTQLRAVKPDHLSHIATSPTGLVAHVTKADEKVVHTVHGLNWTFLTSIRDIAWTVSKNGTQGLLVHVETTITHLTMTTNRRGKPCLNIKSVWHTPSAAADSIITCMHGEQFFVVDNARHNIVSYSTTTLAPTRTIRFSSPIKKTSISSDGKWLAVVCEKGLVLVDCSTFALRSYPCDNPKILDIVWPPTCSQVIFHAKNMLIVLKTNNFAIVETYPFLEWDLLQVQVSPDGVFAILCPGMILIINDKKIGTIALDEPLTSIQWVDGHFLVSGDFAWDIKQLF